MKLDHLQFQDEKRHLLTQIFKKNIFRLFYTSLPDLKVLVPMIAWKDSEKVRGGKFDPKKSKNSKKGAKEGLRGERKLDHDIQEEIQEGLNELDDDGEEENDYEEPEQVKSLILFISYNVYDIHYIENYPCCAFLDKRAFYNMTLVKKGAAGIIFDIQGVRFLPSFFQTGYT